MVKISAHNSQLVATCVCAACGVALTAAAPAGAAAAGITLGLSALGAFLGGVSQNLFSNVVSRWAEWFERRSTPPSESAKNHDLRRLTAVAIQKVL